MICITISLIKTQNVVSKFFAVSVCSIKILTVRLKP